VLKIQYLHVRIGFSMRSWWRKKSRVRVQLRLDELAPNLSHLVSRRKVFGIIDDEDERDL
jgi:hypothetical protein